MKNDKNVTESRPAESPGREGFEHALMEDRRRFSRALYFLGGAVLLQLACLVGFFFYFAGQPGAGKGGDESAASLLERVLVSIDDISELRSRLAHLEEDRDRLAHELEQAQETTRQTKAELRRQLIAVDRERTEFKASRKLFEETVSKLDSENPADRAEARQQVKELIPQDETEKPPVSEENVPQPHEALLVDLNRFLSGYSDQQLQIAGCTQVEEHRLLEPVLQVDRLEERGPAALHPESVLIEMSSGKVIVTCYGGEYYTEDGQSGSLPSDGLEVAALPLIQGDESLSARLCEFLEISPRDFTSLPIKKEEIEDRSPEEIVLETLNRLLKEERGGQYRFKAIERIDGKTLVNVEMEQDDRVGVLKNVVIAKACELYFIQEHKYVEFIFKQGFLVKDNKQQPFFKDLYRLPIPNVDQARWLDSGLDCLVVK
ncbi:MAG: hypothetical protein ACYTG7_09190 [Planctomycetota bacterium]|jgi:hypothetical protein